MRIVFYTLGCKVNQAESGAMEDFLAGRGHTAAGEGICDAVVINTCAVTAAAGQKSRQAIGRLRRAHPGAVVAVCGCLSEVEEGVWEGVDLVGGTKNRLDFALRLEELCLGKQSAPLEKAGPPEDGCFEKIPFSALEGRSRAFIKIQDGCENHCAYCIIPKARGKIRSAEPGFVLEQAAAAYKAGFRELVLSGIEISSYSPSLPNLVNALCAALPGMRFRIGSLDPLFAGRELVGQISKSGSVCPHFHLSFQSGCDKTLAEMGRRYTSRQALEAAEALRAAFPGCAITGDLICGFPGESGGDFARTLEFIKAVRPAKLHIFPYSRRPGSRAADMDGQLTRAEKAERCREASLLAGVFRREYMSLQAGKALDVLFESETKGLSGNYIEVSVPGGGAAREIRSVRILESRGDGLWGEIEG